MQISDEQQNSELFSDFTTSVQEFQLQCDDHQVWLDANRGEEVVAEDPNASSGAVVTAECTGTELPLDDLEEFLQQMAMTRKWSNLYQISQQNFLMITSTSMVGIGDFHEPHGAPVGNLSCIVQESTDFDPQTEPRSQIPQSSLTNVPFSGETNFAEETSAQLSVSGLTGYNNQDADEEFLEINDFFDLEDVEPSTYCTATEHLISSTNGCLTIWSTPMPRCSYLGPPTQLEW
ncbi:hypothetical protein ACP4OV_025415 [Aristida adscensionis]